LEEPHKQLQRHQSQAQFKEQLQEVLRHFQLLLEPIQVQSSFLVPKREEDRSDFEITREKVCKFFDNKKRIFKI
jgi:hypothetical protein